MPHPTLFCDLGRRSYDDAWAMQRALVEQQLAGHRPDMLLFVEHPPTVTIGRRGTSEEVVAPVAVLRRRGVVVTETDRGGQVTYHGPGQLVAYPLVDLAVRKLGLHDYMRRMEESVIRTIARWNLSGYRVADRTGVWIGKEKICAMGIRVKRWRSMHGLALNVSTDLNHFGLIIPCGIRDRGVTSMQALLGDSCPTMDDVKAQLKVELAAQLDMELTEATAEDIAPAALADHASSDTPAGEAVG